MKSRQLYHQNSVDPLATFALDNNYVCAEINEKALQWALERSSSKARKRYQ
jgi:hypothetical protein